MLVNHDPREHVRLSRLDRVAQLVVQRVEQVAWRETDGAAGVGAAARAATARPGPVPADPATRPAGPQEREERA